MTNKHKGSKLDHFLEEEDLLVETESAAIKRVIAYELEQLMGKKHISKTIMANRMHTSRSALERLLDPDNTSITLYTLVKAANVLGRKLHFSLF
jgi:antitoxin HicB